MKITSLKNPGIKYLVRLRQSRRRAAQGVTIVEGPREVLRAFEAGVAVEAVYFCGERPAFVRGAPVHETTQEVFAKIAYGQKRSGVLAVCRPRYQELKDLKEKRNALFVVLDGLEKPGNLGAILRTCDGAGVSGVMVCDPGTDIYNPNVIRASLGTVFCVPIVQICAREAIDFFRVKKVKICAAVPQARKIYTQANLTGALAVVVGREDQGVSAAWSQAADMLVRIPMVGKADSLNVSVSAGILLYEAFRQRKGGA